MNTTAYSELIQSALQRSLDPKLPYVLWDVPNYSNVGDSAILIGGFKALKNFFGRPPQHILELIPNTEMLPALSERTQILLQGGGNFGDLWERHQLFRERIAKEFPGNKIVQMPQSIYFSDQAKLDRCRQAFSAHPDLTIMTRDHTSYEIAKGLHDGRSELVPDMALAIGAIPRPCKPRMPVYALLRTDQEKLVSEDSEILGKIKAEDWIQEPFYRETQFLHYIKRIERKLPRMRPLLGTLKSVLFNRLAKIRTSRGCNMLASGHVVITDRLHAHILCSLMAIPHVLIDNSYGKLSSFRHTWNTGGEDICKQASSLAEAYEMAQIMLRNQAGA